MNKDFTPMFDRLGVSQDRRMDWNALDDGFYYKLCKKGGSYSLLEANDPIFTSDCWKEMKIKIYASIDCKGSMLHVGDANIVAFNVDKYFLEQPGDDFDDERLTRDGEMNPNERIADYLLEDYYWKTGIGRFVVQSAKGYFKQVHRFICVNWIRIKNLYRHCGIEACVFSRIHQILNTFIDYQADCTVMIQDDNDEWIKDIPDAKYCNDGDNNVIILEHLVTRGVKQ